MRMAHRRFMAGDTVGALRAVQPLLATNPKHPAGNYVAGLVAYFSTEANRAEALRLAQRHLDIVCGQSMQPEAWYNLGMVYRHLGHHEPALDCQGVALWHRRTLTAAWAEAACCAAALGDLPMARHYAESCLACAPESAEAELAQSNAAFLLGDEARAWHAQAARLRIPVLRVLPAMPPATTLWDGQLVSHLTLWAEQGYGDAIQMMRYLPELEAAFPQVTVVVRRALVPLIHRLAPLVAVASPANGVPAGTTHYAGLHDLPRLMPRPPATPYITGWAPPAGRRRMAMAWAGSTTHRNDTSRSSPLEAWHPLLAIPDIDWVVPALEGREAELAAAPPEIRDRIEVVPLPADWDGTRALLRTCHGVVTVDTALAHLAGAMGIPTAVLLSRDPDMRWGIEGTTTPWYPSWQFCRQDVIHDWSAPVAAAVAWIERWRHE